MSSGAAATGVIDGIRPQASARAPGTTPGDAPDRRTDPAEETESLDTRKTLRRDVSQNGASPPDQRVALPTHGDQTLRQNSGLALPDTALSPGDMPVEAEFVATETVLRETTGPQSASAFDAPRQPAPKAQAVLAQIAEAARTRQDGQIEITLSPEELGRVRLTMAPSDYGMSVTILAERPETLDLIRRHIDLLSRDLQGQGFGKLDFSFAGSGSDGGGSFEGQFGRAGAASPGEIAAPADELWAPPQAAPTGLDMRL
ncbi:MAG: flagellar hook-length control protein FliK [Pseudomonadota bacterium]